MFLATGFITDMLKAMTVGLTSVWLASAAR
jgi:hypothetical protein